MLILRVQNSDGTGPYNGTKWGWTTKNHMKSWRTPDPNDEFGEITFSRLYKSANMRFGFLTEKQLHTWFSKKELTNLFKRGYNIVEVEIEEKQIILGDENSKQIIFEV